MSSVVERGVDTEPSRAAALVAEPVRLAIVGCGAITRQSLLPVVSGHERIRVTALVDINQASATELAQAYSVPHVLTSIDPLTRELVDAAIIATPPGLHAPQAIALAQRGLHVFVEKPMAIDAADGERMLQAAADAGVTLAVGHFRRLLPSTRMLRGLIESRLLGAPLAIDIEEGGEYGWPLASLGVLTRRLGGGGVLIDIGSHLLDVVQFITPGPFHLRSYADNSRGGVETDALLNLTVSTAMGELPCRVELSRTRRCRNSIRVECERGVLELPRGEFSNVRIHFHDLQIGDALRGIRPASVTAAWGDEEPPIGYEVFRAEIDDWVDAMARGQELTLSGESAMPTVRIIEQAYKSARRVPEPWTDEGLAAPPRTTIKRRSSGSRPRVLITGASGFIGCRAAEVLALRDDCDVRALVRNAGNAARLARLPVEMVSGDVCSSDDVARALDGCDAVVHCAVGTSWQRPEVVKVTVDGTRTVADAARRAGVERFVHISSIAVHGAVAAPSLDESTPLIDASADHYGGDKRRAEDEVQRAIRDGLRAIILRPARVYGPFSRTFITRPIQHLLRGQLVLSGPYDGPSSMVYVDNVVEAISRALSCDDNLLGEAFAINDPDQLSWREFYEYFAAALGAPLRLTSTPPATSDAASPDGFFGRWRHGIGEVLASAEFRGFARKCVQTDPIGVLPRKIWEGAPRFRHSVQQALGMTDAIVYRPAPKAAAANLVFRTESALVRPGKAMARLGFAPVVSRERAMALTLDWVRYSRLG